MTKIYKLSIPLLLLHIFPFSVPAAVIHVPGDQPTIQAGIDAAVNGDTVLVADGTYTGTGNRDIDFGGKAITVKSENGAETCVIDCQGSSSENHRGFYFHNGEGLDSVLQGFSIKNGYLSTGSGGGIYCDGASPRIEQNIITGNDCPGAAASGGGIFCENASPMITGNTVTSNYCDNGLWGFGGGGIGCLGGSPVIKNNNISGNFHYWRGGGIICSGSHMISANIIYDNGVYYYGGGIYSMGTSTIANNTISGNHAGGEGGGQGGGIAADGGAGTITISDNCITGNRASYQGGGILGYGTVVITNNIIAENECWAFSDHDGGGGIYCGGDITITNNTICGNYVTSGGGYGQGGGIYSGGGSITIINSILWSNSHGEIYGSAAVIYSDVQGGYPGYSNINADPRFIAGPLGDYYLIQVDIEGVSFQGSPCVDSGNPASQMISGTTHTDGLQDSGIIDIGYHYPKIADANGPYVGVVDEEITFDASGSEHPDSSITGYRWDWTDDGTWDTGWLQDPITIHIYTSVFQGQVRLQVKDSNDFTYADIADVDMNMGEPDANAGGPYAGFLGEEIVFDAAGSFDRNGSITGYRWDWTDDGTWDTGWLSNPIAIHTYSGEFHGNVRLQVKDNDYSADTDTAKVYINRLIEERPDKSQIWRNKNKGI